MTTSPFYEKNRRRAILPEVAAKIKQITGAEPVLGFEKMLDTGDAEAGADRHAGFMFSRDRREWKLSLSAQKGMQWQTEAVPAAAHVVFLLPVGFGNGSPLPQPSGAWDIFVNDRFAISVRTVNHDQLWQNEKCALAFTANRIETAPPHGSLTLSSLITNESSAAFGPALLKVPANFVQPDQPATIRIEPRCAVSTRWFQLSTTANFVVGSDIYHAANLLAHGPQRRLGDFDIYFGDIHTHSGQVLDACENNGCGMGTREENYAYARGPGGLDFYALTDHEWQIDPAKADAYFDLAETWNADGRFVCLPGYEYTNLLYGHRNVYFKTRGGILFGTNRDNGRPTLDPALCTTPAELWAALAENRVPCLTVPHHSTATAHPLNLDFFHPQFDRLFEIYSSWGSSEYYGDFPRGVSDRFRSGDYRDAVRRGLKMGLIASADGHDGHPGNAQSPLVKHHHIFHFCGSGRAAVLVPELSRAAVFDALYDRRCYATTGVPILLDVSLNGASMGRELTELPYGKYPLLKIKCRGSNGIDHLRIIKNGRVVHTHFCHNELSCDWAWEDAAFRRDQLNSYYVRVVQRDYESAWSSPVWVG